MKAAALIAAVPPMPSTYDAASPATAALYSAALRHANARAHHAHPGTCARADLARLPVTHEDALAHLRRFLRDRLARFGEFEDAIVAQHEVLYHAHVSFLLNVGLLTPRQVLRELTAHVQRQAAAGTPVPHNSLEGFARQLLGWREYMRALYVAHGDAWVEAIRRDTRRVDATWYSASTGITPVDAEIRKALRTGWAHHIVRLMVFLNVIRMQGYGPGAIYTLFMEVVALDAYDWVMVSNIMAIGHFVGCHTRKPYISSSNYLLRVSNYPRGPWTREVDALYHQALLPMSLRTSRNLHLRLV